MDELSCSKSAALEDITNGIRTDLESIDHQETAQQNRLQLHKDNALNAVTNFIQQIRPDVPTGKVFVIVFVFYPSAKRGIKVKVKSLIIN